MPLDIRARRGRAIRRIRAEQKVNQEEAAERCGLHRTYYSGIERGVRNVPLVNIEKVAKSRKVSLDLPQRSPLRHRLTDCNGNNRRRLDLSGQIAMCRGETSSRRQSFDRQAIEGDGRAT